jgi:hypothetical protein
MIAPAMPPMKKPSATMMIASEIGPRISAPDPPPPHCGEHGTSSNCNTNRSAITASSIIGASMINRTFVVVR